PDPPRAARRRGFLAAAGAVDRRHARPSLLAGCGGARHLRRRLLDLPEQLPRAALRRSRHCSGSRHPGIRARADRRIAMTDPAGCGATAVVHDRRGAMKRVLVTGGAGFISSNFIRHLLDATPYEVVTLDALTYAGNLENLADVMSHERLSF